MIEYGSRCEDSAARLDHKFDETMMSRAKLIIQSRIELGGKERTPGRTIPEATLQTRLLVIELIQGMRIAMILSTSIELCVTFKNKSEYVSSFFKPKVYL